MFQEFSSWPIDETKSSLQVIGLKEAIHQNEFVILGDYSVYQHAQWQTWNTRSIPSHFR
jgi:hypothetical protein